MTERKWLHPIYPITHKGNYGQEERQINTDMQEFGDITQTLHLRKTLEK